MYTCHLNVFTTRLNPSYTVRRVRCTVGCKINGTLLVYVYYIQSLCAFHCGNCFLRLTSSYKTIVIKIYRNRILKFVWVLPSHCFRPYSRIRYATDCACYNNYLTASLLCCTRSLFLSE